MMMMMMISTRSKSLLVCAPPFLLPLPPLSLSMREIYTKALLLLLTNTTRVALFDVVDAKGDAKRDDDVKKNVSPSFFSVSFVYLSWV